MNYKKLNMLFLLSMVNGAFLLHIDTHAAANGNQRNRNLPFLCTFDGCNNAYQNKQDLVGHTRESHRPDPLTREQDAALIRCKKGCSPFITFSTREMLRLHNEEYHPGRVVRQAVQRGELGQPVPPRQQPGARRQQRRDHRNDLPEHEIVRRGLAQLRLGQPAQQQQQQMDVEQQQQQQQQLEQ